MSNRPLDSQWLADMTDKRQGAHLLDVCAELMEGLIARNIADPTVDLDLDRCVLTATWDDGGTCVSNDAAVVAAAKAWGLADAVHQANVRRAWGPGDSTRIGDSTIACVAAIDALRHALTEETP